MKDLPPTLTTENLRQNPDQESTENRVVGLARTSFDLLLPPNETKKPANEIPWSTFEYRLRYKNEPCSEADIRLKAKGDPVGALRYSNIYAFENWAGPLISELAQNHPEEALQFSHHYKTQKWAEEVVDKAAMDRPLKGVDFAYCYSDQPWAKDILLKLARMIPTYMIRNSVGFMKEECHGEVRKAAEMALEKEGPIKTVRESIKGVIARFSSWFANQPWAKGNNDRAEKCNRGDDHGASEEALKEEVLQAAEKALQEDSSTFF